MMENIVAEAFPRPLVEAQVVEFNRSSSNVRRNPVETPVDWGGITTGPVIWFR
jgi:hypothetical protein